MRGRGRLSPVGRVEPREEGAAHRRHMFGGEERIAYAVEMMLELALLAQAAGEPELARRLKEAAAPYLARTNYAF